MGTPRRLLLGRACPHAGPEPRPSPDGRVSQLPFSQRPYPPHAEALDGCQLQIHGTFERGCGFHGASVSTRVRSGRGLSAPAQRHVSSWGKAVTVASHLGPAGRSERAAEGKPGGQMEPRVKPEPRSHHGGTSCRRRDSLTEGTLSRTPGLKPPTEGASSRPAGSGEGAGGGGLCQ